MVNVQEGVILGLLDMPSVSYCDAETGKVVPLQAAVKKDNVEAQAALAILHACSKLSLQDALQAGKLDPRTGQALHPETGQPLDVATARRQGLWNPHLVFCVDETSGVTSLGTLMDQGRFDPLLGKIRRPSGELLSLEEAIARGVLTPVIQPEQLLDTTPSLTELIDLGKVNPSSTTFVGPNDYRMSLPDALANGFLTLSSKVKQDPDTGDIYLAQDDDVVRALVDVKENTDWLADVERAMARQARPSQRLQRLKEQIDETQGVRREVSQKEGEVASIQQAEELIAAGGQHKSDTSQQLQKLKYNAADLKLRFGNALNEAESRENKMVRINEGLEEFYFRLDETDQWLDSAIEHTQDLQASHSSLEEQLVVFKDFVEEVKTKEEDMTKLTKTADEFKEQSQEFERDVEAYRTRLQILPTIREEAEIGILDEELESIEAKYKDVSLAKVTSHELGKIPGKDKQDLEAVRTIKSELIGHERRLKELTTAGERLMEGLKEAGLTWLLDDVHSVMEDRAEQHSALLQQIGAREEQLDLSLSHQHNAATRLDAVLDMVQRAEHQLKSVGAISLDKERLADQLQEQRLMNADISSNKAAGATSWRDRRSIWRDPQTGASQREAGRRATLRGVQDT
ncbi:hypothetical protein C0Q70_01308 [Pomacea canaliculata]|uniref:Uncharacterized protein n=1 Tax=Pomacea canaliculata TaxID=400727 RepID=A0A2T7PZ50_POMCA|nr:hypothetical protein C0Q70_01308 [Pomacea canaliculata]